jgi:alkylhydroperoxidase family enzyme
MAWITIVPEASADGELRDAYRMVRAARGEVANIYRVHSVHPRIMTAHLELYGELMFGPSELTRAERETLALAVSATNGCRY